MANEQDLVKEIEEAIEIATYKYGELDRNMRVKIAATLQRARAALRWIPYYDWIEDNPYKWGEYLVTYRGFSMKPDPRPIKVGRAVFSQNGMWYLGERGDIKTNITGDVLAVKHIPTPYTPEEK